MKKLSLLSLVVATFFILAGSAMAVTYTDDYANWPGYFISAADQIGTPAVGDMTITVDGDVVTIALEVSERRVYDSLFINSFMEPGESYEGWDYFYIDNDGDSPAGAPATGLYTVAEGYSYIYAASGRPGHPAAIVDDEYLTAVASSLWPVVTYDGAILTYVFDGVFTLDGAYAIGYTPWCANDVFLTPPTVPEPSTLLLLGVGLLGLVGLRRKE